MEQDTTNNIVNKLATKDQDMRGRRCVGAGNAVDPQDYVTLADLNTAIDKAVQAFTPQPHKFLTGLDGNGIFSARQPDFKDLTGSVSHNQLPLEVLGPVLFDAFWQNGSSDGRRTFGAVYQNLKGTCLYVTVSIVFPGSGGIPMQVSFKFGTDPSVPFTLSRPGINATQPSNVEIPFTFFVPPNDYYEVVVTAGSGIAIDSWYEWW